MPLPGGPNLEKIARRRRTRAFHFTATNLEPSLICRIRVLKTAASQMAQIRSEARCRHRGEFSALGDFSVEPQRRRALREYSARHVRSLRRCSGQRYFAWCDARRGAGEDVDFVVPQHILCTDNAAMIAVAGYFRWRCLRQAGSTLYPSWALKRSLLRRLLERGHLLVAWNDARETPRRLCYNLLRCAPNLKTRSLRFRAPIYRNLPRAQFTMGAVFKARFFWWKSGCPLGRARARRSKIIRVRHKRFVALSRRLLVSREVKALRALGSTPRRAAPL